MPGLARTSPRRAAEKSWSCHEGCVKRVSKRNSVRPEAFSGEVRMGAVGKGPKRGSARFGTLPAKHHDSFRGNRAGTPWSIPEQGSSRPGSGFSPAYSL